MPLPLGVSVGDFIACVGLIKDIIQALEDSQGSSAKYLSLINSLESLEIALSKVKGVKTTDFREIHALEEAARQCGHTLSAFLAKIEGKFHSSLKVGGSGSSIKDNLRKIQWALCSKDDIAHFQAEIAGHVNSTLLLLNTVQVSEIQAVRLHMDQTLGDVQMRLAEQNSLQLMLYIKLLHCATELQSIMRIIVFANIALFHSILRAARHARSLPATPGFDEPAVLEDAFGRQMLIHTQTITSWKAFDFIIRQRFATNSSLPLPYLAGSGQYVLRRLPTYKEVPRGTSLASAFRPGSRLVMTLCMGYDDEYANQCPGCEHPDDGVEDVSKDCPCGILYTRAIEPKTIILMLPAHSNPLEQPSHPHQKCRECGSEQSSPQEAFCGPDPKPLPLEAWEIPTFHDIDTVKNVDFATPLMTSVTDLLGYTYMVSWHVIRRVERFSFFLRWFPAGGQLFHWPQDYDLVDDIGHELNEENWAANTYPGISIKLILRAHVCNLNIDEEFGLRIADALLTSNVISHAGDLEDATERVCSFLGVVQSQTEVKKIVSKSVATFLQRPSQLSSTSQALAIGVSHSLCLICRRDFKAYSALKKHVQSHLVALRCPGDCGPCDRTDLPYFVGEDVAQRQNSGRYGSMKEYDFELKPRFTKFRDRHLHSRPRNSRNVHKTKRHRKHSCYGKRLRRTKHFFGYGPDHGLDRPYGLVNNFESFPAKTSSGTSSQTSSQAKTEAKPETVSSGERLVGLLQMPPNESITAFSRPMPNRWALQM
ncbi:hypothetical protein Q7P37_001923 [Cladosporium fusiforme]